jgi:choline monooxygenase
MSWQFEPNLARASTLPSSWYVDPAVLASEQRAIFAKTWQLVGRTEQVAEPGGYFTAQIANEPLLIVRGNDGELRALSNVCRHRAGPIAKGEGKRPVLQCGYHGWTYALDGRLLTTPEFDGVECFDKSAVSLPRFRVEEWGGLIFVNLDSAAPPLRDFVGDLATSLDGFRDFHLAARKEWFVDCNWKVYVDNYLEGYHIPIVHPSLFRALDYQRYSTETRRTYSIQHAPLRQGDDQAEYYWLFPNLMLNIYPDNYSTNLIVPIGPTRTLTLFEWYFHNPDAPDVQRRVDEQIAFSDEIQLEDIGICEAVQRGLASSTYEAGRFSPQRENGVHHFHGLYAEQMGSGLDF